MNKTNPLQVCACSGFVRDKERRTSLCFFKMPTRSVSRVLS